MSRFADLVIKEERSKEENEELHDLAERLDYVAADLGTVIGPSGTIARLRAGSVVLDNAGLHTFFGGTETGRMEADGDFFLGTDISAPATTSFAFFSNAQTYNSESIGSGDLLLGDNSSGKANLLWDLSSGDLVFRSGTTIKAIIEANAFPSITFQRGTGNQLARFGAIAFAAAPNDAGAYVMSNAYYDGSNWLLDDTSAKGAIYNASTLTIAHQFRYVPAGAGAQTPVTLLELYNTSSGFRWNDAQGDYDFHVVTTGGYRFVVDASADTFDFGGATQGSIASFSNSFISFFGGSTASPAVGINTPLPRQLFEVHKTTWDQTFDEEIADFDAVNLAWDQEADMEENDTSDFDSVTENGSSTFAATAESKLRGNYGVTVTIDGSQNTTYGAFTDPTNETVVTVEFLIDTNTLTMATNDAFALIRAGTSPEFLVYLNYDGSDYGIYTLIQEDDSSHVQSSTHTMTDDKHLVRVIWVASSGADDGYARLYIDGVLEETVTGLDNDTKNIDQVWFGATAGIDSGTSGPFYMDDCRWSGNLGPVDVYEFAALSGTYGLGVMTPDTTARYGQFTGPSAETFITAECNIDPNTLTMGANETFTFIGGDVGADFYVNLKYSSGYKINATAVLDSGTSTTSDYAITDAPHLIRVVWAAASAAAADDGYLYLYIDGVLQEAKTGLDNDTKNIGNVEFGAVAGLDAGTSGTFYMDDCKWRNGGGLVVTSDGDLLFRSGGGLAFGEIYVKDVTDELTISGTGQANKVQVTSFDTNGESNNMTPDHTQDHITVTEAGKYLCVVSLVVESAAGGGTDHVGASLYKNGGTAEFPNVHTNRKLAGGGGDTGSISMSGIIDAADNDTMELWLWNVDSTDNIVVDDVTLSLVMIGGT